MAYWMPTREQMANRIEWEALPKSGSTVPPDWVLSEMMYDGEWGARNPNMYSPPVSRHTGELDAHYKARIIQHLQNEWQHRGG